MWAIFSFWFLLMVLSILTVGLGQFYSTRYNRAMLFYGAFLLIWILCVSAPVTYSFAGFVAYISVVGCFSAFHLSDAWRTAKRAGAVPLRRYNRKSVYTLVVAVNFIVVVYLLPEFLPPPVKAYRIPTSAMEPALLVGDFIVADRQRLDRSALNRGDVVVFMHPTEGKDFIKRVIGLPGETVEMRGEQVLINGEVLGDPWGTYSVFASSGGFGPVVVPPRAYFMLGDNRNNSWDSRAWGCVRSEFIRAKALYIYWARDKSRIGKRVQ